MIAEQALTRRAKERMTPEQFADWQRERTIERRHQERLRAIGESRPRGFGVIW
jgi:hypothetical protein